MEAQLSFLERIFGEKKQREPLLPLYHAIVAAARDKSWYLEGRVPDTVDGRFDMLAATMALVLLRLEDEGEAARQRSVLLTEIFVEDMDGSLRQIGIGEYVVGKHIGRLMGALGGRLTAFRAARADGDFEAAVRRNIYHDSPPSEEALALVAERLRALDAALRATPAEDLLAGRIP
ncbi:MAG: ubiquinol-cytochrome C chaperone family protein [Allosphingosinicella sp.]|uniref:ubiquinol-cytochrome C chaperone family protein n=1 Tax=Allosphingosinicella sp. TaxID=2823234 RepID=UPI003920C685